MESHVAFHASGEEEAIAAIGSIVAVLLILFVGLVYTVVKAIVCWKIFAKAGYAGALGLLMLIPVVGVIMAFVLAFGQWPILRELEHLKQWHAGTRTPPGPQPPARTP